MRKMAWKNKGTRASSSTAKIQNGIDTKYTYMGTRKTWKEETGSKQDISVSST